MIDERKPMFYLKMRIFWPFVFMIAHFKSVIKWVCG